MKKIISVLLAVVLMLSISGCSMSSEANEVNRMILTMGRITLDSEYKIISAENAYANLTAEQQSGVFLYGLLKRDRAYYDYLVAAADYNNTIKGYNAAAESYKSLLPGLMEDYSSFSGIEQQAAQVDAMGPAYDESLRSTMRSVLEAARSFFGSVPGEYSTMESYSVAGKFFKGADNLKQKISRLAEMKDELQQKTEGIISVLENISEGKEIISILRDSVDALSNSVSIREEMTSKVEKLASMKELILEAESGIYDTGHVGTIYFTINPNHPQASGQEYKGAVEIYGSAVEAGVSAEKLSAMSGFMGPAYAEGNYLVRFEKGIPEATAQRMAAIIAAGLDRED